MTKKEKKEVDEAIEKQAKELFDKMRIEYPQYLIGDKFRNSEGKTIEILEFKGGGVIFKWSIIGSRLSSMMSSFHETILKGGYEKY